MSRITNYPKSALRGGLLVLIAVCVSVFAQSGADVVWQSAQAGNAIAYSPDGQLLLSNTKLWRASDGALLRTFILPYNGSGVNAVAFSPDGQFAAIGIQSFNQNLDLFKVSDGSLVVGRISAHSNGTSAIAFSPDGHLMASGGRDGTAKIWHVPDMTLVQTVDGGVGYRPRVFAVRFSKDGQLLAVGGQGGVLVFRVSDGVLVQTPAGASATTSLAVSPDGQLLAAGSNATDQYGQCTDCSIKLWRISDGALLRTIDGNNNGILSVAFSPDQQLISAGSSDQVASGAVRSWRLADGQLVRAIEQDPNNPSSYVTSVAYSPDGSLLTFARADLLLVVSRNNSTSSCTSTVSPDGQSFSASGGTGTLNVTSAGECGWTAVSNASWVTITSSSTGSGSGTVSFQVSANVSGSSRTGTVTVGSQSFTVSQAGGSSGSSCLYSISPEHLTFSAGGGVGNLQVITSDGCSWNAAASASWITINSGAGGSGNGTISFSVSRNRSGIVRRGTITVGGQTFDLKQKG